jgi:RNA polymerase sigma factor (sigma-70 family)
LRSDDETLVNRCLEGDQPAFAFLVNKYKEVVHAYAYRKVGDYQQAEDITQEVFIKAYRKLAQLKWPHRFQSWLYAITSNECKMWLRMHSKEREQEVSWEDVPVDNLARGRVTKSGQWRTFCPRPQPAGKLTSNQGGTTPPFRPQPTLKRSPAV